MINTFPDYNCNPSLISSMLEKIINLDKYDYPEINSNGDKVWYNSEGELHRENGPAVICPNAYTVYWVNGKIHRLDGPAVIFYNGTEEFWEYGVQIK